MTQKNQGLILIGVIALLAFVFVIGPKFGIFAITGSESLVRSMPSTVQPSGTFQVIYTASGTSGTWGASIEDSVTGGCTFPSGSTTYKTVMLSEDGNTKQITMAAPSTGSCVFHGDSKFGTDAIKTMADKSITVSSSSSCTGSSTQSCSITNGVGQQTRTCSGSTWGSWGTCTVVSCNSGYVVSGNTCIVDSGSSSCTGSATQSCSITNGVGQQTRTCTNNAWGSFGTCTVTSCNSGYVTSGNTCIVDSGSTSTFDLSDTMFHIGTTAVSYLMAIIAVVAFVVIITVLRK